MSSINFYTDVDKIRTSFRVQPDGYAIQYPPSRNSVLKIRRTIAKNLLSLPCDIYGSCNNWKWLVLTDEEHLQDQCARHDIDYDDAELVEAHIANEDRLFERPDVVAPPMYNRTLAGTARLNAIDDYKTLGSQYASRCFIEQAIINDIQDAVPVSMLAMLTNSDGIIVNNTPLEVLQLLETRHCKIRPSDVNAIETAFRQPYEDCNTIDEYFRRQNECIEQLADTGFAIRPISAIYVCLGNFQKLSYLKEACIAWETLETPMAEPLTAANWKTFCEHFCTAVYNHDRHDSMDNIGLANLAYVDERLEQQRMAHAAQLAAIYDHLDNQTPVAAPPAYQPVPPATIAYDETQTIAASAMDQTMSHITRMFENAMTAAQNGTPNRNSNHRNNDRASNRNDSTNGRTTYPPRRNRKFTTQNYCWTHGADLPDGHTGSSCRRPAPNHVKDATIDNRQGGSFKNVKLVRPNAKDN